MADHRALGRLGWTFGAITALVLLTAAAVVTTYSAQTANAGNVGLIAVATPSSSTR